MDTDYGKIFISSIFIVTFTETPTPVIKTNEERENVEEQEAEPETTLYLKNLSFNTTEQNIRQVYDLKF